MVLKDCIYSAIIEHQKHSDEVLGENKLIEIRKQMIIALEEECNITLKNDVALRHFFQANAANLINKSQKKKGDNQ